MDSNKIKKETLLNQFPNDYLEQKISNPINTSKIMPLSQRSYANRLYGGWAGSNNKLFEIDYNDIINAINDSLTGQVDSLHLFYSIYNNISIKFNLNFIALGIYNSASNYINIKLIDKNNASYNSKILLSDSENVVVKAFKNKQCVLTMQSDYLKMSYIANVPTHIIPLNVLGECLGVMIFSDNNNNNSLAFSSSFATPHPL